MNAVEIEQAVTELAEQPFDLIEFPYAAQRIPDGSMTEVIYDPKTARLVG